VDGPSATGAMVGRGAGVLPELNLRAIP